MISRIRNGNAVLLRKIVEGKKKGKRYVESVGGTHIPYQEDLILHIPAPSPIPKLLEIIRGLSNIPTNCSRLRSKIFQSIMSNASLRSTSRLLTS